MYIYVSKILPLLVMPVGVVIELVLLALLFSMKRKRRPANLCMFAALLVLWIAAMPIVGNTFLGRLEQAFPAVKLQEIPVSKCMVVLGGAVEQVAPPRVEVEMYDAADRVRKAAQLYHVRKARVIIVASGKQLWSAFATTEAQAIKTLLLEWGVPDRAIVLEGASRNTRENALNTRKLINQRSCGRPLLITSAAHMQRAVGVFEKLGIQVFPVSVDVRVVTSRTSLWLDFLPDADALKMTSDALREWLGQKVYQWQGWN